jgi:hypothetical protein
MKAVLDPTLPTVIAPASNVRGRFVAWIWLTLLVIAYLVLNVANLRHTVADHDLAQKMAAKDSRQYIEIAQDFAVGDFSMSYVQDMPHRQPLYPLFLAPAVKVWGQDLFKLGFVNILVGLATLVCLYFGLLRLGNSVLIATLVGLMLIGNPFMVDKISARLMTEPAHALCLVVLIVCFLAYLGTGRRRYFLGAAAAAGFDYLARTNGLFVMAAMVVTFVGHDLFLLVRKVKAAEPERWRWLRSRLLGYLAAGVVFMIAASPSWVPRYRYFGKPFFHGYLSNFLWADTYEQAHTGQAAVAYDWHDYARSHGVHDFLARLGEGLWRVYWDIPKHTEHVRILYFLALIGVIFAFVKWRWEYVLLAVFLFIQLLPVVWTIVANSGPRVSYGTFFPFELFFAALALSYLVPLAREGIERIRQRPGENS